jgi:hypothetical protein
MDAKKVGMSISALNNRQLKDGGLMLRTGSQRKRKVSSLAFCHLYDPAHS